MLEISSFSALNAPHPSSHSASNEKTSLLAPDYENITIINDDNDDDNNNNNGNNTKKSMLLGEVLSNSWTLIGYRLLNKVFSFILNACLYRMLTPAFLGVAMIKLDFLHTTMTLLIRDGMRMSLFRLPPPKSSSPSSSNKDYVDWMYSLFLISWRNSSLLFFPIAVIFGIIYKIIVPPEILASFPTASSQQLLLLYSHFWRAFYLYLAMIALELLIEPLIIISFHNSKLHPKRLQLESLISLLKSVLIVFLVGHGRYFDRNHHQNPLEIEDFLLGLASFSLSNLISIIGMIFSLILLLRTRLSYLLKHFRTILSSSSSNMFKVKNNAISTSSYSQEASKHGWMMTKQVSLKYFLSQGDVWIVSVACSLEEQGLYGIVTHYGSFVCRLLFQPLDEASLLHYSQNCDKMSIDGHLASLSYLSINLRLMQLLALFIISFGPFLCLPIFLSLLGKRWLSSSGELEKYLSSYCLLLPLMGISGNLEAFLHATIKDQWIYSYGKSTIIGSFLVLASSFILSRCLIDGPLAMIFSSYVNFSWRTLFSLFYIASFILERSDLCNNFMMGTSSSSIIGLGGSSKKSKIIVIIHFLRNLLLPKFLYFVFIAAFLLNSISYIYFRPLTIFNFHTFIVFFMSFIPCFFLALGHIKTSMVLFRGGNNFKK